MMNKIEVIGKIEILSMQVAVDGVADRSLDLNQVLKNVLENVEMSFSYLSSFPCS